MSINPRARFPGWLPAGQNPQFRSLACHNYDSYNLCKDSCWWYSRSQASAYTLTKQPNPAILDPNKSIRQDPDPRVLLQTIFERGWTTGELLFEDTSLCLYPDLDPNCTQAPRTMAESVTVTDREMFYRTTRNTLLFDLYVRRGPTMRNIILKRFSKSPFSSLLSDWPPRIGNERPRVFSATTSPDIDSACLSQLNLTVLDSWTQIWYMHRSNFTPGPPESCPSELR